MTNPVIYPACSADTGQVYSLLNGTALYLQNKGIMQWEYPFDKGTVVSDIKDQYVFLVREGGQIICTFSARKEGYYWPADTDSYSGDTAYFYKFALRSDLIGGGTGGRLMPLIENYLKNELTISRLRLDCWAGSEKLKKFYSGSGYSYLGDYPEEDYFISLFEKEL